MRRKKINYAEMSVRDNIMDIDFICSGGVEYDTNSILDENHEELCRDDYCRCSTMEVDINSVDSIELCQHICDRFDIDSINIVNQIRKVCDRMTNTDFEAQICGGYYGEELDHIRLENYEKISDLENIINIKMSRMKKLEKIELSNKETKTLKKILISEYGYLLESLKDSKFSIIEISTSDVIFPSKKHADNVGKKYLNSYRKHKICGIVKERNGKYLVVDGYHRTTVNLKSDKIKVILSE